MYIEDGKMKEGVSTQQYAWMQYMRSHSDLCEIDFGSEMFLALIALLMVGNVSVIYYQSHGSDFF